MTEVIQCPECGSRFSDTTSYQNHLPCRSTTIGKEDVRKEHYGKADEGGTGGAQPPN